MTARSGARVGGLAPGRFGRRMKPMVIPGVAAITVAPIAGETR